MEVDWYDLHESVRVWFALRAGWPPVYTTWRDMPPLVASGLRRLLCEEARAAERKAWSDKQESEAKQRADAVTAQWAGPRV